MNAKEAKEITSEMHDLSPEYYKAVGCLECYEQWKEKVRSLVNHYKVMHNTLEENGYLDHAIWADNKKCDFCKALSQFRKAQGEK